MSLRIAAINDDIGEMEEIKLFTHEESRTIWREIMEFEDKINVVPKHLKSYEDYIIYERCLLKDVRVRRDKLEIGDKSNRVEERIIQRVMFLYESAMQHFMTDYSIYLAYLRFCKEVNHLTAYGEAVSDLIKLNLDKPNVWKLAAGFHAYSRGDLKSAMELLSTATKTHTDYMLLYKEIISVEMFNADDNNSETKVTLVRRLKEIMHTVFDKVDDYTFYIDVLTLLEEDSCTIEVQDMIISKLMSDYNDNELVWHTLAQRERKGLHYGPEEKPDETSEASIPKAKLEACFAKYKEGLEKVSQEVKKKLWGLYLDSLFEMQRDVFDGTKQLKIDTLLLALNECYANAFLQEKHFISWLNVIEDESIIEVTEKGIKMYPESVTLWDARLNVEMVNGNSSKVDEIFKLAIQTLKEKASPIWLNMMCYHHLSFDSDQIELFYRDGIKQPKEISDSLKPNYVKWICSKKGIESARELYNELAVEKPYCKELHKMMSKLESFQVMTYDFVKWEEMHQLACKQVGNDDVDVWINYIDFYLHYYKIPNSAERVIQIRNEAEQTLPQHLIGEFLTKFSKLQEF